MTGPDASELWQVRDELSALDARRGWLVRRHDELLAALRARRDAPAGVPAAASAGTPESVLADGGGGGRGGAAGGSRREVSVPSARTALLIVGGVLVIVAALVFTVVSWGRLGIGGRAAVLLALTACALALPRPLRRRQLTATAEASAAVGLALVLLDGYAARQAGLVSLDRIGAAGYWAVLTLLAGVGAAAYGWWQRLRLPLPVGFLVAQLPGPLAIAAWGGTTTVDYATAMIVTAAVDFAVLYALTARATGYERFRDRLGGERIATALVTGVQAVGGGWAVLGGALAVTHAVAAHSPAEVMRAWLPLGLLALLGVALCRGFRTLPFGLRSGGAGAAVVAVIVAVGAGLRYVVPLGWAVVGYAIPAALATVWTAAACARHGRWTKPAKDEGPSVPPSVPSPVPPSEAAPAVGGLIAASTALLLAGVVVLPELAHALLQPLTPGVARWRNGHAAQWSWQLAAAPLIVLWLLVSVLAATAVLRARAVEDRHVDGLGNAPRSARAVAAVLRALAVENRNTDGLGDALRNAWVVAAVPALLLVPVVLGLPYGWVLAVATGTAVAVVVDFVRRPGSAFVPRLLVLAVSGALALMWSWADRAGVLAVWGTCAVSAAVLAHVLSAPTAPSVPSVSIAPVVPPVPPTSSVPSASSMPIEPIEPIEPTEPSARPAERATARVATARVATARVTTARVAGAFAALALGVEAVASGRTADLPWHLIGFAVLAVALVSAGAAAAWHRLPGREQVSATVEGTGYALAALALALTASHADALSLALAVTGLAGLAIALRPDRRRAALAGTALLIASSWVRLALADITLPEAYTLPVTVVALVIGHRRRTSIPETGSWPAYGPGLGATMLPSLAATWTDPNWLRPLLLGTAALLLTVIGVRSRLQAPLIVGGGVLMTVGLHELAPAVVQVLGLIPRWLPLAAAGLLLLLLGATYEKRIDEARRLRDTVRSMR
ncbi:hypothetical protein [Streptomyces sp. NPDC003077]|uniref:SCO7613 C-terminal domain-containing membrane protein n=1 Tax=Streptomyces sp. NPDC003077 TaxID=3154443 RepID=UPI00339FA850